MNNFFTKSILVLALFSPWVHASVSESGDNCNATEGLDGWAIWCGVDTYLAQQEPTAAGSIEGGFEGVVEPDVRTLAFGGSLLSEGGEGVPEPVVPEPVVPEPVVPEPVVPEPVVPEPVVPEPVVPEPVVPEPVVLAPVVPVPIVHVPVPVPVVEPEIEYNWQGYAMLTHPDFGGLQAGELKLKVDTATGEVIGLLTTASGEEIAFNEGARFYVSPELIPLIDSPLPILSNEAGTEQISQFEVASEGSLLKLVTFPQGWLFSAVGGTFDPEHASVSTIGQINDGESVFGSFVAGSLTPLDRMNGFASLGRVAEYSGYGMYSGIGRVDNAIKVDFGAATWFGAWYGSLNVGAAGTVSGNQFSSNTMNGFGNDSQAALSGNIQGSFNGNNASTLTGVLDVVKNGEAIVGTFKNVIYRDSVVTNDAPR